MKQTLLRAEATFKKHSFRAKATFIKREIEALRGLVKGHK